jgi:hypothetical protein
MSKAQIDGRKLAELVQMGFQKFGDELQESQGLGHLRKMDLCSTPSERASAGILRPLKNTYDFRLQGYTFDG